MNYEDIRKANEEIRTTNIKGKEYAEVNQRIKAFRMVYPSGFILTDMVSNEDGICVFRAMVGYHQNDTRVVLATGTAYEREDSSFINKTSYIENCETSAIGRALGMVGFGIDMSVASAEEVQNAMLNQKAKVNKPTKADLIKKIRGLSSDESTITNYYKVDKLEDLKDEQLDEVVKSLEKVKGGKKK